MPLNKKTLLCAMTLLALSASQAHADFWDMFNGGGGGGGGYDRGGGRPQQGRGGSGWGWGSDDDQPQQPQAPRYSRQDMAAMTQDERNQIEEARLGRPMTAGELEVKVAMDKFIYQPAVKMPMVTTRLSWTEADEVEFGNFVASIGKAVYEKKCGTATACFRNPAINKYAPYDPPTLELYTDCADLPYFLRAYFAYHEGLPFNFVTGTAMSQVPYASVDDAQNVLAKTTTANSPYGNKITSRGGSSVAVAPGQEKNFVSYVNSLIDIVATSTNRVGAMTPGSEMSDMFPVPLNRQGIRPGSVVAATGHAMIVWAVTPKGEIRIIDGHPGSFIQEHLLVNAKIKMSRPDQGIGYYQFRPLSLVGAKQAKNGSFYGGKIVPATNTQLIQAGRYSLEQFFGPGTQYKPGDKVNPNLWKTAFKDTPIFAYITKNLIDPTLRINVAEDIAGKVNLLCSDIQERVKNYENARSAGISSSAHPASLIQDVFGSADAVWEKFSTPGGDSRMREAVKDIANDAVNEFRAAQKGGSIYVYSGSAQDFATQLRQIIAKANSTCAIAYTNSAGKKVGLSLNDVTSRLNRMSFDPYMCLEKNWGATGDEMKTCKDQDAGNKWYDGEKFLRNTIGKNDADGNQTIRSDRPITLSMLANASLVDTGSDSSVNLGTKKNPVMNLDLLFSSDVFLQKLTE